MWECWLSWWCSKAASLSRGTEAPRPAKENPSQEAFRLGLSEVSATSCWGRRYIKATVGRVARHGPSELFSTLPQVARALRSRLEQRSALLPPHTLSESFQPRLKLGTLVEGVAMASSRSKLRAAVRTLVKTRERPRRRIRRRVESKGSEKS